MHNHSVPPAAKSLVSSHPYIHAEPLSFDAVAEELQQHWQATQTAPAAQPQTLPSAELSTHSSNTNSQASSDATTSDQALVHDDFLQSSFQLLQPFSDAGIARQSSQVLYTTAPGPATDQVYTMHDGMHAPVPYAATVNLLCRIAIAPPFFRCFCSCVSLI